MVDVRYVDGLMILYIYVHMNITMHRKGMMGKGRECLGGEIGGKASGVLSIDNMKFNEF